jgi:hypothetical protein
MKQFIIAILLLSTSISIAQVNIHVQGLGGVSEFATSASMEEKSYSIKGSPYYNKDFMYGKAETNDGRNFNGLFRYNMYNEEMEFIYKTDTLIIDNPISLKYIHFAAKKFTFSVVVDNFWRQNYIYGSYFEVLNEGPLQLLIKFDSDLMLNRYVPFYGGGGGDGNYRYISSGKFYIRLNIDEPAFKFKTTKKFIMNTFPDHNIAINEYIKTHKIDLKKQNDLVNLFEYINSL